MKMDDMMNAILAPCSSELPCGEDLSFSPEFDRIQEARREDDPTVDYGEWQTTLKQADWPVAVSSCSELLATRSKDMRLAAWLAEGLIKTQGLGGLQQGISTFAELLERFGPDIHPQAEDGDQEQRLGNLSWFIARMSLLTRQAALTDGKNGAYSLNDYEAAQQLQAQLQRDPDASVDLADKATLDKISNAVRKTRKENYVQWNKDVSNCIAAVERLAQVSDDLFEDEVPSFSPLRTSLKAVQERLNAIAAEVGIAAPSISVDKATEERKEPTMMDMPEMAGVRGPIRNRAQALDALREVAAFFRDTEPHSPVAYLADKAAQWGAMPLHAWLRSVVKDRGTLSNIEELLGVEAGELSD